MGRHKIPGDPFNGLPQLQEPPNPDIYPPPPSDSECYELWNKYAVLPNIRRHSQLVAHIAGSLAQRASDLGITVDVQATRACGLLHDLAKTWCLTHKGAHAELGASWTVMETGHQGIGQGVLLHVSWPWELPQGRQICQLPIFVLYADKRVRHDQCVSLDERFSDLIKRYGKTPEARAAIDCSQKQSQVIEERLSQELSWRLNEDTFNCGRLVFRA